MKRINKINNKEVLLYLIFGVLTTIVNFIVYFIFKSFLSTGMVVANALAWIISVLFAFITNRKWVFNTRVVGTKESIIELVKFVFYRGISFFIDMLSMLFFIEIAYIDDFFAKLITQIIVVVTNYLFSKWLIFKK